MRHAVGIGTALFGHLALALPPEPGVHQHPTPHAESCIMIDPIFTDRSELDNLTPILAPVYQLNTQGQMIETFEPALRDRGASNNRINLVFVGDGYLSSQLGQYALDVQSGTARLFAYEPFKTYQNFFAIFRVDVVSTVSGVTNDPTQGIVRDTPLQMNFWCGGTERALCVNTSRARQYANNAPFPPDQVLAVANSSKYGGVGYPSLDVGTYAGSNSAAPEIAVHELGHSFSDLADEYDYGGSATYSGGEPSSADVSIYPKAQMQAQSRKWFRWLGVNDPAFDGLHDTFEGANYSLYGIYRPTNNSMMRSLYRPFNLPSAEQIIASIYKIVKPIDATTPTALTTVDRLTVLNVSTIPLVNHSYKIEWLVGTSIVPGQSTSTFDLGTFNFRKGAATVRCRVTDESAWVRNPSTRTTYMTHEAKWYISIAPCLADLTGDRLVDDLDFTLFASAYDELLTDAGDLNGDGQTDDADFVVFASQYDALACP